MRTGSKISSLFLSILLFGLISCQPQSVEADMDAWCACEKEATDNPDHQSVCDDLKREIAKKYEFDPQAIDIIKKKVQECK